MIEVTKMNGRKVLVNPDLIELVEETPDTVVLFTTGRKIIIKESRQEVKNLVKSYRKDIFADSRKKVIQSGFSVNSWFSVMLWHVYIWYYQ